MNSNYTRPLHYRSTCINKVEMILTVMKSQSAENASLPDGYLPITIMPLSQRHRYAYKFPIRALCTCNFTWYK